MILPIYYLIPFVAILVILFIFLIRARKRMDYYEMPRGRHVYGDMLSEGKILVSKKYRLSGKPDRVIENRDMIIPYEFKSSDIGEKPWEPHIIQMGVYFIILQEAYPEKRIEYGIIKYRNRSFYVDNTQELRDRIIVKSQILRRVKGIPNRNHDSPGRCEGCKYRSICRERLR
ncbi:MAG: CRISPR-associated protein Cas4 [Cuniculiplasma sp.]